MKNMTQQELIQALRASRARFEAELQGLSEVQMVDPGVAGEWSLKDLLSHLTAWEAEAVRVVAKTRLGQKAQLAASGDAEVDAVNQKWYKENRSRPLENVLADWQGVRRQLLRQVESLSDADLKKRLPALGNDPLWKIIHDESSGHETEHLPQVQAWRRDKLGL